ncbi:hypothetical protein BH10PSE1_BH10PSE1_07730 [soil metagenome]
MRVSGAMAAGVVAGGCCLVLAGCATPVAAPVVPLLAASAPAPVAGYDWFYHADAEQASLAYGLKDSDDLRLGLACSQGDGKLELSATAPTGVREIRLESGGDTETFAAEGEPSQLHEGDFLTAESKTNTPVFQRFRRIGWMAQWHGDRRETYVAHAATGSDIERFFAFCG